MSEHDELAAAQAKLSALESEAEAARAEWQANEDLRREIMRKLTELNAAEDARKAAEFDRRRAIQRAKMDITLAEQRVAVENENIRIQHEADRRRAELLEATANAKWQSRVMAHQKDAAVQIAAAGKFLLAHSMGLGKTLTSVAALDMAGAKKVLVVCPGEIMSGFLDEFKSWSDRRVVVIGQQPKARVAAIIEAYRDIELEEFTFIVNYESWARNKKLIKDLISIGFDAVIIDEAHTIKEPTTSAFQGVRDIVHAENMCPKCGSMDLIRDTYDMPQCKKCGWRKISYNDTSADQRSVKVVLPMTGTPILNRPDELWSALYLMHPDMFPTQSAFLRQFCTLGIDNKWRFNDGGMATLARKLTGMYQRLTRESAGVVLPPQKVTVHSIDLDPEKYPGQAKIMEMLQNEAQLALQEYENSTGQTMPVMGMLALLTRQRQAASWPGGISVAVPVTDESGMPVMELNDDFEYVQKMEKVRVAEEFWESVKLDRAQEMILDFAESGERVVVFSQFKETLKELGKRLGPMAVEYHGDTKREEREEIKRNFNRALGEEKKWDAVLCHYKTGGVGLNLTGATQVIILDEEWNDGKNQQAYDRVNRMGQTQETGVHILRLTEHIDTWLAELVASKKELVGEFNDETDKVTGDLTDVFRTALSKQKESLA